jgi:ribosomal protein S18 acetylase RimI-like enzyme
MNFVKATTDDCALIREIAEQIWAPTYCDLMSPKQLDYMFEMMYSVPNLERAMTTGGQTFLIFYDEGSPVGYISYETLGDHSYYLQKIYLLPSKQGRGNGRQMLDMFLAYLCELDPEAGRLGLNVNRDNRRAIDFYRRNGFEIVSQRDKPIGSGYFMYDYILERNIVING